MRKGAAAIAAACIIAASGNAGADTGAVRALLRAADAGGADVAGVSVEGGEAVVDLRRWTTGHPDDLLSLLGGAAGPGLGVEEILLRIWDGDAYVPVDDLFAPPDVIMRALMDEGQSNLIAWRGSPPPPRHYPATGSCLGKRVFVSAGHGWTWFGSSWLTQRGYTHGIIEDFSNAESVNEYLIPMLERMGATVMSCRERGRTDVERVVDNDGGGDGAYVESGPGWRDGMDPGHGGSYRACPADPAGGSEARFTFSMPAGDVYPVHARWIAGPERGEAVPVRIVHDGGETHLSVNQTAEDDRWTYLGGWYFEGDREYEVAFSNQGPADTYVIADAVRIGGGMGDVAPGGEVSGHPRWEEAAKYWIQYLGAPDTVYDQAYPDELFSDHYSRPSWAEWEGGDAYLMYHSNAFDGTARGTVSFIHRTSPSPGSAELADLTHGAIIDDVRAVFDPDWYDRGVRTGNYIELAVVDTMPAVLLELAFHDNEEDAAYLTDPDFRFHVSRALARGFGAYFSPGSPAPPLPPERVRAVNLGGGAVRIEWEPAADAALPGTPVDRYRIYASATGRGFDNGDVSTEETSIEITGLDWPGNHYFLVTAENDAGESMPSETIGVRSSWPGTTSPVLLVGSFDRLDRWAREYENTRDFAVEHGEAIAAAADGAYSFDFTDNEAVASGDVSLGGYEAVIWYCGEESVTDESFTAGERTIVEDYLMAGGSIFVSGSEIGWDLVEVGELTWLEDVLHVTYEADDAETYGVGPLDAGIFSGLDPFSFDPASGAAYDADYPDVVEAAAGAVVDLEYAGGTGGGASVEHDGGDSRAVFWGFPFEAVDDAEARAALMERILLFLVPDVPVPPEAEADVEPVDDASTDPDDEQDCSCHTECGCTIVW